MRAGALLCHAKYSHFVPYFAGRENRTPNHSLENCYFATKLCPPFTDCILLLQYLIQKLPAAPVSRECRGVSPRNSLGLPELHCFLFRVGIFLSLLLFLRFWGLSHRIQI